jgi:hypothetical protein
VDSRYIKYKYANLCIFQVDSRWTPENHLESSGVHLNSVGQCKVLHNSNILSLHSSDYASLLCKLVLFLKMVCFYDADLAFRISFHFYVILCAFILLSTRFYLF